MFADNVLIVTIVAAFLIAVLIGPLFIPVLRRLKFGQAIREEGPDSHQKKAGTPTMGGTIILLALIFTVLKFANAKMEIYFLLLVTLGYGLIGFLDDFIKIKETQSGPDGETKVRRSNFAGSRCVYPADSHGA